MKHRFRLAGPLHPCCDWKSGTRPPRSGFQLDFYRYGLDMDVADAGYWMLDRVRRNSMFQVWKWEGLERVMDAIRDTEKRKQDFFRKRVEFQPSWYCGWCPVREYCPEINVDKSARLHRDIREYLEKAEKLEDVL